MTVTITWAFTHKIATRDDHRVTAECGRTVPHPGRPDQGVYCPDCYPINTYPTRNTT